MECPLTPRGHKPSERNWPGEQWPQLTVGRELGPARAAPELGTLGVARRLIRTEFRGLTFLDLTAIATLGRAAAPTGRP